MEKPHLILTGPKGKRLHVHARQVGRLESLLARLLEVDRRFFWLRLIVFLFGGLLVFITFALGDAWLGGVTALVYAVGFLTVVLFHRRNDSRVARVRISLHLIQRQMARMKLDWVNIPLRSQLSPDASHPFDSDLNLSGARSLHHLLDTAISQGGSQRLRGWLLETLPDRDVIEDRQSLLKEIIPLAGFRRRIALLGEQVSGASGERWDGEALVRWLNSHSGEKHLSTSLILLFGLALLNLVLFILNAAGFIPPYWIPSLLLYATIYISKYRTLSNLFQEAYHLSETLDKFRAVLVYLEKYPYPRKGRLSHLCRHFWDASPPPSGLLRRLSMVASAASLQGNPFVWILLNTLMPWDLFFAHLMEGYKERARELLPGWLEAWYELEAVNSLANFAYLNQGSVFPTIHPSNMVGERPVFRARKLGHPLIPDAVRIANDFEFDKMGELAIITGSNMSGKSTFLRTLGINLVLAYAGGPVTGAHLETLPFRLYTSMNLADSLNDGISYFYAEVKRLKGLLDAVESGSSQPVFFLIDEIFRGTNNRERQIGSRAYIQNLAGGHAVGAVATHDLELARLADELPQVYNFHFRENVLNGRMVFDYRLRPGPCPTTNALKIMQIEGLPIGEEG
jgi:hypothetical protein